VLSAFWEAAGGRLADRWAAVSIPALVFWLGGLAARARHRGGLHTLTVHTDWLGRQSTATQIAAVGTVLLGVAVSGVVVAQTAGPARRRLTRRLAARAAAEAPAWQAAYDQVGSRRPRPAPVRRPHRMAQAARARTGRVARHPISLAAHLRPRADPPVRA
jgi:hypothetical protein